MMKNYLIVLLINEVYDTTRNILSVLDELNVCLESMDINSPVDDTAWVEVNCKIDSDDSISLEQRLSFINGVIEIEFNERCSGVTMNNKTTISVLKTAG